MTVAGGAGALGRRPVSTPWGAAMSPCRRSCGRREDANALCSQLSASLERCAQDRHAKTRAGGGADDLGVPGITVPGVTMTRAAPKASAERIRVPRLPGSCRLSRMRTCCGAVGARRGFARCARSRRCPGGSGRDGAVEDVACSGRGRRARLRATCGQPIESGLTALAEEDGFEGVGRQRMASSMRCSPSRPRRSPGLRGFAAERGAQLLDAGVGAAGDGRAEAHPTQCTRRVADDRAARSFAFSRRMR